MDVGSLIIGVGVGWFLSSFLFGRMGQRGNREFDNADMLAIVHDPAKREIDIVPLTNVGESLFIYSPDVFMIAPESVEVYQFKRNGKPVVLGISFGKIILPVNPTILASLGIAKMGLKTEAWNSDNFSDIKNYFLRKWEEQTGEITLNPEAKFVIAYDIPTVFKNLSISQMKIASAVIQTLRATTESMRRLQELALQHKRLELAKWNNIVMLIIMALAILAFILISHH
ncbi:MAG: hypothetical protein JHC26_01600 [Thermofilum sp.]|uniref:hypothetical protein n=1 Tax=Thermofilum sp. TaxID=1961369 RepID=UPI00258A3880|nr:hypothetical protein [Thermofilum sp.]MCI4407756.1 hypothetical protein [Thermofilum sp.]